MTIIGKKLAEMTLEGLWKLLPIYLTEAKPIVDILVKIPEGRNLLDQTWI